jgi:hypothetical protein
MMEHQRKFLGIITSDDIKMIINIDHIETVECGDAEEDFFANIKMVNGDRYEITKESFDLIAEFLMNRMIIKYDDYKIC